MVVVRARLMPEAGAALLEALEAARDQLYEKGKKRDGAKEVYPEQRKADALGLVAEAALAGGLDPGTRGDRYQVVVHVDEAALPAESEEGGSALEGGSHVSAETSRRLACDAAKVEMRHGANGAILDVGRRTRTIPPALRRALAHRDGGCRFPGCNLTFCDAHHVEHWADGGETKLDNLVQLCRRHHRAVHEEGYTVEVLEGGRVRFCRPDGRGIPDAPSLPRVEGDPFTGLEVMLAADGIEIDPRASEPTWDGGPVAYGMAVEHLLTLN